MKPIIRILGYLIVLKWKLENVLIQSIKWIIIINWFLKDFKRFSYLEKHPYWKGKPPFVWKRKKRILQKIYKHLPKYTPGGREIKWSINLVHYTNDGRNLKNGKFINRRQIPLPHCHPGGESMGGPDNVNYWFNWQKKELKRTGTITTWC